MPRWCGYNVPLLKGGHVWDRDLNRQDYRLVTAKPHHLEAEVFRAEQVRFLRHGIIAGGDYVPYEVCSRVEIAAGATVAGTAAGFLPGSNSVALAGSGASTLGSGGFWYVGRSLRIVLYGVMTTAASAPGTWTHDWKVDTAAGGTTGNSFGISAASATLATSISNGTWTFTGHITCRSIGTGGTLFGDGVAIPSASLMSATQVPMLMPATAPATAAVDTTQNSFIKFNDTLGSASDNMNITMGFWEVLN